MKKKQKKNLFLQRTSETSYFDVFFFYKKQNCTTEISSGLRNKKDCQTGANMISFLFFFFSFILTVWKVSKESNRWERCDETTQCSCNAVMKYVECIVNGSLYRSLTMPWDVEVMYVLHDVSHISSQLSHRVMLLYSLVYFLIVISVMGTWMHFQIGLSVTSPDFKNCKECTFLEITFPL